MAGQRKFIVALAFVIVLAAFAFFVLSRAADKRSATGQTLPDGSTLRLGTVQFTNGNFSYTATRLKGWQTALLRILPVKLADKLVNGRLSGGITFGSGATGTNLCVFTIHEGRANSKFNNMRIQVFDDLGNTFDAGTTRGVMSTSDMINELRVEGWCPPAFPRRGKMIGLRFYEWGKSNAPCLAEFTMPNPAPGNYPVWTPESLPATRNTNELTVTLVSLQSGLSEARQTNAAASNEIAMTQAAFRIVQSGNGSNSWRPKEVEISDATGNHWTPFASVVSNRHEDGMDYFSFEGALWSGEATWKMRFEFSRVADFDPAEVFTFSDVVVPGATQVINLENSTNVGGSKLQLVAITGEKAKQPGNLKWSTVEDYMNVSIKAAPFPKGFRLNLLRVTDDSGREAEVLRGPDWNSPERVYPFKTPKGAKQLNFTFALHKSRFVEFLAKPEYVYGGDAFHGETR
ncbi:MAG TPA: hypothetical protein VG754_05880 [Verrucomicrobiae bacterium]|nr:hypothetical protein [Verrucomicrobiae bacterium]